MIPNIQLNTFNFIFERIQDCSLINSPSTIFTNINLLKKGTLEMKKSHIPVLVLKYSSYNTVFY